MPRLVEFQNAHPELDIVLHCDMQRSDVAGGECDITIELELPENTLTIAERIGALHLMPFASNRYLREAGSPESVDDWPKHRIVWQEADQVASHLLPYVLGTREPDELMALRTNSSSAHFRAICSGGGIGILPTYARAISRRVHPLDLDVRLRREIYCVTNPRRLASSGVQHALGWIRRSFDGQRYPWFSDEFVHPHRFERAISSADVIVMFEGFIDALDVDDG
jgi:DNA-binding transcriptional LysR family regulator